MTPASTPVLRFQFSIDGQDLVDVALPRFRQQLGDLREFWVRYAAPKLYRDIERNFEEQGVLSETAGWTPLSPGYAAWKAKHYPGRPLLVRSGALKESLTFDGDGPGPEGLFEASRDGLIFGTRIKYARHHQRPTGSRPPMRRILFLMKGASETFGRLLHAFALDVAKKSGLRTREAIQTASGLKPLVGGPGGPNL
jgi:phage gpG-like protein